MLRSVNNIDKHRPAFQDAAERIFGYMHDSTRKDLADRQIYNTSIGPVCMSQKEYQEYQDQLAKRQAERRCAD